MDLLRSNDVEHFVVVDRVIHSRFKPKHWDTSPIAELLNDASRSLPSSRRFRGAGKIALAAFQQERKSSKRFPKGVQTIVDRILSDELYPDSIPNLMKKRLRKLVPEVPLASTIDFSALQKALGNYSQYIVFLLVRTWANGWTTSVRMHGSVRRICMLG